MSVRVEIRLLGMFRQMVGADRLSLEVERPSVKNVVRVLATFFPAGAKKLLVDPDLDDPRPNALILLNGREISVLNGLETEVTDGDEITFVPVVHGG